MVEYYFSYSYNNSDLFSDLFIFCVIVDFNNSILFNECEKRNFQVKIETCETCDNE